MNSSRATMATAHIFPKRRIWVKPNGEVVNATTPAYIEESPTRPETKFEWTAYVKETASNTKVENYPELTGLMEGDLELNAAMGQALDQYLDKLKYADGNVDVAELRKKIEVAVWEIHVDMKEHTVN